MDNHLINNNPPQYIIDTDNPINLCDCRDKNTWEFLNKSKTKNVIYQGDIFSNNYKNATNNYK